MKTSDALVYWFVGFLFGVWAALSYAVSTVEPKVEQQPINNKPALQFGTSPPDCKHLYNVDKHAQWAACMGVSFIPMMRNDI